MDAKKVAAIVVGGGNSRRMGSDKLWVDLAGKPVFLHCLETLQSSEDIGQIILVVPPGREADFRGQTVSLAKLTDIVPGGAERHLSVWAGLEKIASDFPLVAVHDAARPLLSTRDLQNVLTAARVFGAASLAAPVSDTLKRADAGNFVCEAIDRAQIWAMQTPQVFATERLRMAYENLMEAGEIVTDEVSAVAKLGDQVKLVPAQDLNFKLTYSCDIELARLTFPLSKEK